MNRPSDRAVAMLFEAVSTQTGMAKMASARGDRIAVAVALSKISDALDAYQASARELDASGGGSEPVGEVCRPGHPRPDSASYVRLYRDDIPDGTKLYASPADDAGVRVPRPQTFADHIADGWRVVYEPDTRFVGMQHPLGGRMSVAEVCKGFAQQGVGEFIAAALSSQPAASTQEGG